MPCSVIFYALKPSTNEDAEPYSCESTILGKAVQLCIDAFEQRKKITVLCESQTQAEEFDELLWRYPGDKFLPHNLYGEGPDAGTPIELMWYDAFLSLPKPRNSAVVLNLCERFLDNHHVISQLIDFVPHQEQGKILARERYKQYKAAHCQLQYNAD